MFDPARIMTVERFFSFDPKMDLQEIDALVDKAMSFCGFCRVGDDGEGNQSKFMNVYWGEYGCAIAKLDISQTEGLSHSSRISLRYTLMMEHERKFYEWDSIFVSLGFD